jgi:hypothetical protein
MHTLLAVSLRPYYLLLTLFIAWVTLTLAVMVPNAMLVWFGLAIDGVGFVADVSFILSLYGSLLTNFTPLSASTTVFMSLLFGLNVSLLVFYMRMMRGSGGVVEQVGALSLSGLISGFFGIGCAVCGSVILTSLLSLVGAAGLLAFLPLGGEEFSWLSLGLLMYALVVLVRRIERGRVCAV